MSEPGIKLPYSQASPPARNLPLYGVLLLLVLTAGYLSRRYPGVLPLVIRKRTGDALWADVVFVLILIGRPRVATLTAAAIALAISFAVEFSQIYHAPWIDHLRSYWLGRMILGTTFYWRDLIAYTVGIAALVPVDIFLRQTLSTTRTESSPS